MANEILRVGFPTNDEVTVEEHFGHCEKFVVYSVKEGEIVKKEVLDAPEHAPGVFPKFIAENNIHEFHTLLQIEIMKLLILFPLKEKYFLKNQLPYFSL